MLRLQAALERGARRAVDRLAVSVELVEAGRDRLGAAPALELGERCVERGRELEGGLAAAALVEVDAGAQRELLAGQRDVAAGEQGGEPLLGVQSIEREGFGAGSSRAASQSPSATCSPEP